jgi:hypothetical protein
MVGMSTLAVNQSGAIFIRVRLEARQVHEERSNLPNFSLGQEPHFSTTLWVLKPIA